MSLLAMLRKRYAFPEYALLPEVRNRSGLSATRSADAIAMGLWPSRGLALHGFEIKVSRGDWLREKKNPAKAEEGMRHCEYLWLVASDGEVVKPGELPDSWGLLVPRGQRGLVAVKEPEKRKVEMLTNPVRHLLAACLRRAAEYQKDFIGPGEVSAQVEAAASIRVNSDLAMVHRERDDWKRRAESAEAAIKAFEGASGLHVASYNGQKLGASAKALLEHGPNLMRAFWEREVATVENHLLETKRALDALVAEMPACATCHHSYAEHRVGGGWGMGARCRHEGIERCVCADYMRAPAAAEPVEAQRCTNCGGEPYACDSGMGCDEGPP